MARAWTDEQKAAASARAKARNAPATVSEEESFLARMKGEGARTTREDATTLTGESSLGQDNSVTVEHKSGGTAILYRHEVWGGWTPVTVPRAAVSNMIGAGFRINCGDCQGHHGPNPNECPGREPLQYRVCPQPGCSKQFHDIEIDEGEDEGTDPMRIVDAQSKPTTAAERTMSRMNQHIRAFHEGLAYQRGLMNPTPVTVGP